jgi:hypothetical protein
VVFHTSAYFVQCFYTGAEDPFPPADMNLKEYVYVVLLQERPLAGQIQLDEWAAADTLGQLPVIHDGAAHHTAGRK